MAEKPDAAMLKAEDIFKFISKVAKDYVAADRRLLAGSLGDPQCFGNDGMPVLQFAGDFSSRLRFDISVTTNRGFLFGLFKRKRSEQIAELAIQVGLGPEPRPEKVVTRALSAWGTHPLFITPGPYGNGLHIALPPAENLLVTFGPEGKFADTRATWQGRTVRFDDLDTRVLAGVFELFASWIETGQSAPAKRMNLKASGLPDQRLVGLLSKLLAGANAVLRDTASALCPSIDFKTRARNAEEGRIRSIARVLGADALSHGFRELSGRFQVLLTEDGRLATKPFQEGAHRYDVWGWLDRGGEASPRLVFGLKPPDLLVDGPLHEDLQAALARPENAKKFLKRIPDSLGLNEELLGRFLATANLTIARVKRSRSSDEDILFYSGTMDGITYDFIFVAELEIKDVDEDDGSAQLDDLDVDALAAYRRAGGAWSEQKTEKTLKRYIHRLLLTYFHWQRRLSPRGNGT